MTIGITKLTAHVHQSTTSKVVVVSNVIRIEHMCLPGDAKPAMQRLQFSELSTINNLLDSICGWM